MTTGELITSIIMFAIAGVLLLFSIRSFLERGFLLNNAYLYASKEERKTMNKKPYYKQSAMRCLSERSVYYSLRGMQQSDQCSAAEKQQLLACAGPSVS